MNLFERRLCRRNRISGRLGGGRRGPFRRSVGGRSPPPRKEATL